MTMLALEFSSDQRSVAVLQRRDASGAGVPPADPDVPSANGSVLVRDAPRAGRTPAPLANAVPLLATRRVLSEVIEASQANSMKPVGMPMS